MHQYSPACKILKTIFKKDKGRTLTNDPKNKEIDDDTYGTISER